MNNTTTISLNDRFSLIKKPITSPQQQQPQRGRSRSRSRGRQQSQPKPANLQGTRRNRVLLDQLEKQHKMRLAMKLKNVRKRSFMDISFAVSSIFRLFFHTQKSILTSRGRAQGQLIRTGARRAAAIKKAVNVRQLKRSNTLTTYVP
jgi:hypothetical protein